MRNSIIATLLTIILFMLNPAENIAQDSLKYFLNVGYISNLKKCPECIKADQGGSVRIGILTKGKLGFYTGYLWFNEFHPAYIDYDDKGQGIVAGIDLLLLRKNDFQMYANLGIFTEKFISTYATRTESETSIKPDLGLFLNYKRVNAFLGWQPSDPPHFNVGLGVTLFKKDN